MNTQEIKETLQSINETLTELIEDAVKNNKLEVAEMYNQEVRANKVVMRKLTKKGQLKLKEAS